MPVEVYSALDTFLLSAFAFAWVIHSKAAEQIAKSDFPWIVPNTRGGTPPNAWLSILNSQASNDVAACDECVNRGARFGLPRRFFRERNLVVVASEGAGD